MSRRAEIADAAIATLARDGMRGLTHRAVDRAAGLGRSQERRDRVVPAAEPAAQPGQPVICGAFRCVGRGVAVDPPVRERDVAEPLPRPHDSELSATGTGAVTIRQVV